MHSHHLVHTRHATRCRITCFPLGWRSAACIHTPLFTRVTLAGSRPRRTSALPPTLTSARPPTRVWEVVDTVAAPPSIVVNWGVGFFVWSFVVLFLSCVCVCCSWCMFVCDLFLFLQAYWFHSHEDRLRSRAYWFIHSRCALSLSVSVLVLVEYAPYGHNMARIKFEVDALGVITISRGCFERCGSNKKTPP